MRELGEESGYAISELKLLQPDTSTVTFTKAILQPVPATTLAVQYGDLDHYHTDLAYVLTVDHPPGRKMQKGESDSLRTFTVAELRKLTSDETPTNVQELSIRILETILKSWQPTAADKWQ